jgi:MFS transporter, ACS family, hexuronate transporter
MSATRVEGTAATSSLARPISFPVCVVVFFTGNILLWADRTNFSVAASAWAHQYDWRPATIGAMLSAFSLGYLVMQPFGGWLADRIGPRKTFSTSMAGWSLWVLLTPIAPGILWLTGAFRVLLGMSEAPYIPAIAVSIAKAVPSDARRGRFSAFMQSGAQLGPAAGVFFAGLILSQTKSPAMIFVIFGVAGLLYAAGWWLYAMNRSDPAPSEADAQTPEAIARAKSQAVPISKLITSKKLWPIYIGYFALPYCQYIFLTWLPQYLTHYRHFSLVTASFLSAFPFIVAWVGANLGGWLMDFFALRGWTRGYFHRKSLIAAGAVIYATCTLIAATTASNSLALDMIVVANFGLSVYVYPYWTTVTDIAPKQSGILGGLMNGCGIVGATISPYVSGVIAEATGAFVAPLQLAAGIMIVAALVAILFMQIRPIEELVRA